MFRLLTFVCLLLASASALVAPRLAARRVVARARRRFTEDSRPQQGGAALREEACNRAHGARCGRPSSGCAGRALPGRRPRGGPPRAPAPPTCGAPLSHHAAPLPPQVLEAVQSEDYAVATPALSHSFSSIDKNVKRGIMHKNTAARKKSQLALKVKALEPGAAAAPAAAE